MHGQSGVTTYLFTDIEGSTRLWEQEPERMRLALARHDQLTRAAVEQNCGRVVKTTGDGFHAVFEDPLNAVQAALQLQLSLSDPEATAGTVLRVRTGLHAGVDERRDNDFFGPVVNRAARIMGSAHGGQILISHAVAALVGDRLPKAIALRDLGRVRLRGLDSSEPIFQVLHPQLRNEFPALRFSETTPNNLPQQVTSFIGRERELAEVRGLLRNNRLLTLLGIGGLGKSRLSLQIAAEALDDYADGVWFVELAALTDERLVPEAVASVLGVKEEAGHPVVEALAKHVKDRRLLVILDNCEHLIRACAETAKALLQAGPGVTVLTSSREALRVTGETTYKLAPLSVPESSSAPTAASLLTYDAVHLFVSRAAAVQPGFAVSDLNAAAVAQICNRLDGIPLAIELAAARTRSLSVDTIATRLNNRFRLLTRGDQTALPRQQTLRAMIDWSYDLLTPDERTLFRRLAVFSGSWTLEAAEAVTAGGDLDPQDILDLTGQLVDKSLIAVDPNNQRFRLLDTVREYSLERLASSDENDSVRARHLAYYVSLAEKARPALMGPDQGAWLTRLDAERENLLSAHAWCGHAPDGADIGLRLVNSVKFYWPVRGLLGLGHRVTMEALDRPGAQGATLMRSRTLHTAGQLESLMGCHVEAQHHLEEALAIARKIGDRARTQTILQAMGLSSLGQGDLLVARKYLEEATSLAGELGDKRALAVALNELAQLTRVEGNLAVAISLYEQALAIARELGDRESTAVALLNFAMALIGSGSTADARRMVAEVLAIAREIGSRQAGQGTLDVAAGLAARLAGWSSAARFFGAAEAQLEQTGLRRHPADELFLTPLIAGARSAVDATTFAACEAAGRKFSYDEAIADVGVWLERGD